MRMIKHGDTVTSRSHEHGDTETIQKKLYRRSQHTRRRRITVREYIDDVATESE